MPVYVTKAMKTLLPVLLCSLLISVESASSQTWSQTQAPVANLLWTSVCSSADGSQVFAVAETPNFPLNGPLYESADSGGTWVSNTFSQKPWASIASSADGVKLVAVASQSSVIYTSTNAGASWTNSTSVPENEWTSVASSADGVKLVAVSRPGSIYTSANSGANWSLATNNSAKAWTSVASSADGSKLVAAAENDTIYTSADSGATWISNNLPQETWVAVACSADGNSLAAAAGGFNLSTGPICLSTNFGATWITSSAPVLPWTAIASSADGSKLIAAAANGAKSNLVFTSTDRGTSWSSNNVPREDWSSVAASADGSKLFAAATYGGIWSSQSVPTPWLNLASSSNGLAFSWLVPSTNFVLQENSDLSATDWITLSNTPTLNLSNLNDEVVLPPTNSSGYFRLVAQ